MLIKFSLFYDRNTTKNINISVKKTIKLYNFLKEINLIIDFAENTLKLKENYPLIICFAHCLHTSVANAFNGIIQNDKYFTNTHKALIELKFG